MNQYIGKIIFLIIGFFVQHHAFGQWISNCDGTQPMVNQIMIDACASGPNESLSEYILFQTGSASYDISGLSISTSSGTDNSSNFTDNPAVIAALNALVGTCPDAPIFQYPPGGIVPPNSIVWAWMTGTPDLAYLTGTDPLSYLCDQAPIYVIFGDYPPSAAVAMFLNSCSPSCSRTITVDFGPCDEQVTYMPSSLPNGTSNGLDGNNITPGDNGTVNHNGSATSPCVPPDYFCVTPDDPVMNGPDTIILCEGDPLPTLTCSSCDASSEWYISSGSNVGSGTSYTVTFAPTPNTSETYYVQNVEESCESERDSVVIIQSLPINEVKFRVLCPSADCDICEGESIDVNILLQPGPPLIGAFPFDVTLDLGNGTTQSFSDLGLGNTSATIGPYNTSGNYTISVVKAEDKWGCVSNGPFNNTLSVEVSPSVTPVFSSLDTAYCVGDATSALPGTSDNGVTGNWTPSNMVSTSTAGSFDYTFTPIGECDETIVQTFTVSETPDISSNSETICSGESIDLDTLSVVDANGTSPTITFHSANPPTAGNQLMNTVVSPTSPTVYYIQAESGGCTDVIAITIGVMSPETPTFSFDVSFCQDSTPVMLPTTSDNGIDGTWSPNSISTATLGSTSYTFTPDSDECANQRVINIEIIDCGCSNPPAIMTFGDITICENEEPMVTAIIGGSAITRTWSSSGSAGTIDDVMASVITYTPSSADIAAGGVTLYAETDDPDGSGVCMPAIDSVVVTINEFAEPTFDFDTTYCQGDAASSLPGTSMNMIDGSWMPNNISTATTGTTTYTFTPDPNQCAEITTVNITVSPEPDISLSGDNPSICEGQSFDLSSLTIVDNNMTGATITYHDGTPATSANQLSNTTVSPSGSAFYYALATLGDCTDELQIQLNVNLSPDIMVLDTPDVCLGGTYNISSIPLSDLNSTGATYTFHSSLPATTANELPSVIVAPTADSTFYVLATTGSCTDEAPIEVVVIMPPDLSTVDMPSICTGGSFDLSTITVVDANSTGATYTYHSGTPANTGNMLSSSTVMPSSTTTYYILATSGSCTDELAVEVAVNAIETPTFSLTDMYCTNDSPDALPNMSSNGFSGTWSPSTISTTTAGMTDYVFTVSDAGCYETYTLTVTVTDCGCMTPASIMVSDDFAVCAGETISVDTLSTMNASTITWSSSGTGSFDNANSWSSEYTPSAADISAGSVTLTATTDDPDGSGPCTEATDQVTITINQNPDLSTVDMPSICAGGSFDLSTITVVDANSTGATYTYHSGTPANTGNMLSSSTVMPSTTTTYYILATSGTCTDELAVEVEVNAIETPTFSLTDMYCTNDMPAALPTTSSNGFSGTWSPSTISTTTAGMTDYVFTVSDAGCYDTYTLTVTVTDCGCMTPVSIMVSDDFSVCVGETISVDTLSTMNASTITWSSSGTGSFDSANSWSSEYTPSATDISAGSVTLTATTDDPDGAGPCTEATDQVTITINQNPDLSTVDMPSICAGGSFDLSTITVVDANSTSATYTYHSGTPANTGNVLSSSTVMPSSTTTYYILATSGSCTDELAVEVAVNAIETPTFSLTDMYCTSDSPDALPNMSSNGYNGTWNPSTISTTTAGMTNYVFTVSDAGCYDTYTLTVNVTDCDCPTPAVVTVPADFSICAGMAPQLSAVLNANASTVTWSTLGDGTFNDVNSFNPLYTPGSGDISTGSVVIRAITDDPDGSGLCEPDTATLTITIDDVPDLSTVDMPSICAGGSFDLSTITVVDANSTGATYTYHSGTPANTGNMLSSSTVMPPSTTTYYILATSGSCSDELEVTITVNASPDLSTVDMPSICAGGSFDLSTITVVDANSTGATYTYHSGTPADATNILATNTVSPSATTTYYVLGTANGCADELPVTVTVNSVVTADFTINNTYCQGDTPDALSTTSNNGITGTWSPSVISTITPGPTNYLFTPDAGQCSNPYILGVNILLTPDLSSSDMPNICLGESFDLSTLSISDANATGASITYHSGTPATTTNELSSTDVMPSTTTTYYVLATNVSCSDELPIEVTVNDPVDPTFSITTTYCTGDTPDALLLSSTNGIDGTWTPLSISTTSSGMSSYIFTPDPDECANPFTLNVTVTDCGCANPAAIEVSGPLSICAGETITVDTISTSNASSITWSSSGSGTFDNPMSASAIYTPSSADIVTGNVRLTATTNDPDGTAGPCSPASDDIIVIINAPELPVFTFDSVYCISPVNVALPTDSDNGIMGTWSPAQVNIGIIGTTVHTFTPAAGTCASSVTKMIQVVDLPDLSTTTAPMICAGQSFDLTTIVIDDANSTGATYTYHSATPADASNLLPSTTVSPTVSTSYFILGMSAQGCMDELEVMVTIETSILPEFMFDTIYCENSAPDILNTASSNGILGTWSPATISTTTLGTTNYTFTPDAGQCAEPFVQAVLVNSNPDLSTPNTYSICQGDMFDLNTVTIIDAAASGASYTFHSETPADAANELSSTLVSPTSDTTFYVLGTTSAMCAAELAIPINVNMPTVPEFTIDTSYCVDDTPEVLPTMSNDGIFGTWVPDIITTTNAGTTVYTFVPANGLCASSFNLTVVVEDCDCNNPAMIATTPAITICEGSAVTPTASLSGTASSVTWSSNGDGIFDDVNSLNPVYTPGSNDVVFGTVTLTGTTNDPDGAGPCNPATSNTVITINSPISPMFDLDTSYCLNDVADVLPLTSSNGVTGTWTPSSINTSVVGSATYTFNPGNDECAESQTITVVVSACDCPNPPTVSIEDIQSVCALDQATLSAIIGGDAASVTWSTQGDGSFDDVTALNTNYTFGTSDISAGSVNIFIETNDPDGTGPCVAAHDTVTVVIDAVVIPTFTIANMYCVGDATNPLPTTSINGITGTWNQDTINTEAAGNFTYTFTPDAQFCAQNLPISITIDDCDCPNPAIVQVNDDTTICAQQDVIVNAVISGGANSVTWTTNGDGTFENNTALLTTYTPGTNDIASGSVVLTATTNDPDGAGPCVSASDEIIVTINSKTSPLFDFETTYCRGETADNLATTSNNGIAGTWMPNSIDTDVIGFSTYTFMPSADQCADTITIDVQVNEVPNLSTNATPEICAGQMISLDTILVNDLNSTLALLTYHDGTPATDANELSSVIVSPNTTTTYYVRGTSNGCTDEIPLTVTVNPSISATFDLIKVEYCVNETPDALPSPTNGVTGTWSPNVIDVSTENTTTYTFTPNGSQCAETFEVVIAVEDCPCATPPLVNLGASIPTQICFGEEINLSASISGTASAVTWSSNGTGVFDENTSLNPVYTPSLADSIQGNVMFTVTTNDPDGSGPCVADTETITVNINSSSLPVFNLKTTYCQGESPETLNGTSNNGVVGTWTPTTISTDQLGTTSYEFIPSANCSQPVIVNITVQAAPDIEVAEVVMICPNNTVDLVDVNIDDANNSGAMITFHSSSPANSANQLAVTEVSPATTTTYYALAVLGDCSDEIPIIVNVEEMLSPIIDVRQPDCNGENAMISILALNNVVLPISGTLSDGQTFEIASFPFDIIPSQSGTLRLELVSSTGCDFAQDITIMNASGEGFISVTPNQILLPAAGQADIQIETDVSGNWTWLGNPDLECDTCAQTVINITESKAYTVEIEDENGCRYSDVLIVRILEPKLYIPNAFSPNNDGVNDFFLPFAEIEVEIFEFKIFNRWGDLVYARENLLLSDLDGWNGYFNEKLMTPDAFGYIIKGRFETGKDFFYNGELHLMR